MLAWPLQGTGILQGPGRHTLALHAACILPLVQRYCISTHCTLLCCLVSIGLLSSKQSLMPVQGKASVPKSPQKQPRIEGLLASAAASGARAGYSRKRPAEDSLEIEKQIWPSQWLDPKQDAQSKR